LSFSNGVTSRTIIVTIKNDIRFENTEYFYVNLSNLTGGGTIGDAQASVTIFDDDEFEECNPICP
jgi:hypothetical protein